MQGLTQPVAMQTTSELPIVHGPHWPGVRILCTTRAGGVSADPYTSLNLALHVGDAVDSVVANRQRLRPLLPSDPLWLNQVHGIEVFDADGVPGQQRAPIGRQHAEPGMQAPTADAVITTTPGRVLALLTADCVPIVIASSCGRALGLAHAGWRGLAGGIVEATLQRLQRAVQGSATWRAWIGPCIGPQVYEVGEDVYRAFAVPPAPEALVPRPGAPGKWLCNLPLLARARLQAAGVEQVETSGWCTVSDSRFYSYRRDGVTGRFATLAWLEPSTRAANTARG